ncbi:TniQ protein [Azorhizobium sp. AG788]|uniref:TniQ family protein n=1 Tax=Azorhizobium sp. AG788 TaxID=2183897 RepID=UPI00105CBB23|nr:TniQ family protein [Azorhizobium sp. AG788]TDT92481.1 TniQ protein [Azorhizobium sp. AG788]
MDHLPQSLTTAFMRGETPASFCSRVAAIVGRSARAFCCDFGLAFMDIVDGRSEALSALATLTGASEGALVSNAMVRYEPRQFTYRGHHLVRDALSRATLRVCPHCLRKDMAEGRGPVNARPYGRAIWLIDSIRTCPEHHVPLPVISEDDHPQRVHDFALLARPHLRRFDDMTRGASERAPSSLERYLLRRLEGEATACWLDELPFYVAARSCEVIGAVIGHGPDYRNGEMTDALWHRAGGEGFDILSRGKDGVHDLLTGLQEAFPGERIGLRSMYGRLESWLGHDTDDSAYDPLRRVLAEVAAETMPLPAGRGAFGHQVDGRRLHSIRSASKSFKIHPKRLRKFLLRAGYITEETMSLPDDLVQFPADAASDFLEKVGRSMSLKAARDYLGLPRPLEQHLLKAGILVPFIEGSKGDIDHAFDPRDLDDLLARLVQGARPADAEDGDLVSVSKAATRACVSGVDVVRLLLDGALATVKLDPGGRAFAAIRVDPEEISRAMKPELGGLSLQQVEKRMETSTAVVKALVDLSILPSKTIVNPISRNTQRVVDEADVEAFLGRYISARNLAVRLSMQIGIMTATMREQGIAPAFEPDEVKATFFDLSQVQEAIFD